MVEKSVGIGLILFGILEWVERAGFFEPLAPNAVIIAQGTEQRVLYAWKPARCLVGFLCMYRYSNVSDLL